MPTHRVPWHVLLIGIDAYAGGGAPPLGGCVNDIDAIQRVLIDRLGVQIGEIKRLAAPLNDGLPRPQKPDTKLPTAANLRAALAEIAAVVGTGHRVFVYYSGHGTRRFVKTADGNRHFREALVPHDNVVVDSATGDDVEQLVFDWELNKWLSEIAAKTDAVTMILDCCCAAGATRDVGKLGSRARFAPAPGDAPAIDAAKVEALSEVPSGLAQGAGSVSMCMVVAACLDTEVARESDTADGATGAERMAHGELTRALLAQLPASDAELSELSWAAIWRDVVAAVSERNPFQTPWLSSHIGRRVFCGPPTEGDIGYTVKLEAGRYLVNAGTMSGVTEGAEIGVYPPVSALARFPRIGSPEDLAVRIGVLRVVDAARASAVAEAVEGQVPPVPEPATRGRLVKAGTDRLRVSLEPHDEGLAKRIAASPLVEVVAAGARGELHLLRTEPGDLELTDDVFGPDPDRTHHVLGYLPAAAVATAPPTVGADPLLGPIEHYMTYAAPLRAAKACTDLPHVLRIHLLDCGKVASIPPSEADARPLPELTPERAPDYRLRGQHRADGLDGDRFTIELESLADQDLFVTVFICQNAGDVDVLASKLPVGRKSRARLWVGLTKGVPLTLVVPDGAEQVLDRIVAIGTTDRAASLDHLQTTKTFRSSLRAGDVETAPPPPALWTSAIAVLRSAI